MSPGGDVWYVGPEGVGTMTPGGAFLDRDLSGNDIVAGPDGHMWVTRWSEGTILEFDTAADPTGEFTAVTPRRILDTRGWDRTGWCRRARRRWVVHPGGGDRRRWRAHVRRVGGRAQRHGHRSHSRQLRDRLADRRRPARGLEPQLRAGSTVPNLVTVAVGQGGTVDVYNAVGSTHVVFDIVGFYATGSGPLGSRFQDLQPFRLFDTRSGTGGVPPLRSAQEAVFGSLYWDGVACHPRV